MIQLHPDYLLFQTSEGQIIPCSAELVAVELIGEAVNTLDPGVVQEAAAAVLHYFRQDLGWTTVSVGEFSRALAEALRALGIRVHAEPSDEGVRNYDLRQLARGGNSAFELSFFTQLREELRSSLGQSPKILRFHGLRPCVKELTGAKRWSQRCQTLSDHIVEFLRDCLASEQRVGSCELVVC